VFRTVLLFLLPPNILEGSYDVSLFFIQFYFEQFNLGYLLGSERKLKQ
jgi:hypothetical protein